MTSLPQEEHDDAVLSRSTTTSGGEDGDLSPPDATEADPCHPFNWPLRKKWTVTLTACLICFLAGINSTSITAAATDINARFGESDDNAAMLPVSYWPVTAWNTGAGVFPMFMLPLMEDLGVYRCYVAIYILFTIFVIPQAVCQNFATLIITRAIAGSLGGVLQNVLDGIVADLFEGEEARLLPMTLYIFSLIGGVSFGPVFGGAVISHLNWRWMFYIQLIIYASLTPLVFFCIHETRLSVIMPKSKPKSTSSTTSSSRLSAIGDLFHTVLRALTLLSTSPTIISMTLLSSYAFGLVFLATQSAGSIVFPSVFGFSAANASLVQASLVIGEVLGVGACLVQNHFYRRSAQTSTDMESRPGTSNRQTAAAEGEDDDEATITSIKHDEEDDDASTRTTTTTPPPRPTYNPTSHLPLALLATLLTLSPGLLIYGATSLPSIPWIAPAIGLALTGFGIMCVVQSVSLYVTDAYAANAASAIAGVALGENLVAAFVPLATDRLYASLGVRWGSLLLGFLALGGTLGPGVLIWRNWRKRQRYGERTGGG